MAIYAAELRHEQLVVLLLYLASVGTFLHTGLKLPYFTWFGPKRAVEPAPIPWNMYAAMGLAAAMNVAIGVDPKLLYDLMPFPVDYRPYTVSHVIQNFQLLIFTGLGFWLLIDQLGGKATITLDFDWFYRRPARLLYRITVLSLDRFFAGAERMILQAVRALVEASANPVSVASRRLFHSRHRKDERTVALYDPNRYRPYLGFVVLLVLSCLVLLLAWNLFVGAPPHRPLTNRLLGGS
jgi:multicomponent Na+:H+ antiporter subunit D